MASLRGLKRRAHDGKRRYSREQAERAARWQGMEAYRCGFCGGWHVGHRSPNRRRKVAEDARPVVARSGAGRVPAHAAGAHGGPAGRPGITQREADGGAPTPCPTPS
jgi:hypothetical protein